MIDWREAMYSSLEDAEFAMRAFCLTFGDDMAGVRSQESTMEQVMRNTGRFGLRPRVTVDAVTVHFALPCLN